MQGLGLTRTLVQYSSTNAYAAGIATYATSAGVATNAYNADIATNVIGGIASVTALNVSGGSTFTNIQSTGITSVKDLIIYGNGNLAPTAKVGADKTYGPANLTVNFSSSGSSDPEGGALTYSWNFGDGSTSSSQNPSHTFTPGNNLPKKYVVVLTVTDNQSATET